MKNKLNSNIDLKTMPTGTYPNGEAVTVTVESQDGEVIMNRTIQL